MTLRFLPLMILIGLANPAGAQTRAVSGQSGILGEWAYSATVTEQDGMKGQWNGPVTITHVGFCGSDGPEEKIGELRLRVPGPHEAFATLLVEGTTCTFKGRLNGTYDGVLTCPGRRDVPMMLSINQ